MAAPAARTTMWILKELAATGRAVIHYDQIGNGKSTHLPDKGGDFWTVDFFLGELDALLAHLGVAGRYALLGQSWGGMLSAEHAVRRPAGLKALILANSLASMALWIEGALQLRADCRRMCGRHLTSMRQMEPRTTRTISPQPRLSTTSTFAASCRRHLKSPGHLRQSTPTRPSITR